MWSVSDSDHELLSYWSQADSGDNGRDWYLESSTATGSAESLWKDFWWAPTGRSGRLFVHGSISCSLQATFSDTTPLHLKWQKYHRSVFVLFCEDTFRLRVSPAKDCSKACCCLWKTLTSRKRFKDLELERTKDLLVICSPIGLKQQPLRLAQSDNPTLDYTLDGF